VNEKFASDDIKDGNSDERVRAGERVNGKGDVVSGVVIDVLASGACLRSRDAVRCAIAGNNIAYRQLIHRYNGVLRYFRRCQLENNVKLHT